MKGNFHDLPEKEIRSEDVSVFRYMRDGEVKITSYRRFHKNLQVSINQQTVRCISNDHVSFEELVFVEKLLKEVLPNEVLLMELFRNALNKKGGVVEISFG